MVTADQLREYVETMRRGGVTRFKAGDLEIDLGPAPPGPPQDTAPLPKLTYDQMLFAASEGLPEDQ